VENTIFTDEFHLMLRAERPDYGEIRRNILRAYNRATGSSLEDDIKSNDDRLIAVVGWLNDLVVNGIFDAQFLGWKPVGIALYAPDLSSKASILSQFHCPLCYGEAPIGTINIRIPPISLQSSDSQTNEAFKRAIKHRLSSTHNYANKRLCVHVVFVLRNKRHRMDVDNMAKGFLDSLQGVLYDNDNQIDHLNLHKLMWEGDEEHISVNIRESNFNRHEDVLYHKFLHSWAGAEELRLEDFIDTEKD
jgi:Holliday junction resolvase RusA-like endonuclease